MPASFFPVARKEYFTRRHAAFGALYDQNSTALDPSLLSGVRPARASDPTIALINPPPGYSADAPIALRGGVGDGYQSYVPSECDVVSFALTQCSSKLIQSMSLSNDLATLAPNKKRSNAYTIESFRHVQRPVSYTHLTLPTILRV